MVRKKENRERRLSEEDPGVSGVDPGRQAYVSGQWRGRLRPLATRREEPEAETVTTKEVEQLEAPQVTGVSDQPEIEQRELLPAESPSKKEGKRAALE